MAKTRLEKIASYEEQIAHIRNLQKQERQRLSKEERTARTRRLCSRHGLLEKMLPEIITITDEQYQAFLEKAVANQYGRDILNKIIIQTNAAPTTQTTTTAARNNPAITAKPAQTEQDGDTDEGEDGGNGARVTG